MYEAPALIGTCLTCITPANLGATIALIVVGFFAAVHTERRQVARAKSRSGAK